MKFVKEDGTELEAFLVFSSQDLLPATFRYLIVQVNPPEFIAMVEAVVLYVYGSYNHEESARAYYEEGVREGEKRLLFVDTFTTPYVTIPNTYLEETL